MYDQVDEHNIPKSAGIPRVIYVVAIFGIIAIFTILSLVFANSGANHVWPSGSTLTIPLSK